MCYTCGKKTKMGSSPRPTRTVVRPGYSKPKVRVSFVKKKAR